MATVSRRLRDFLLAKFGQEDADNALPAYLVEDLEAEARRARETQSTDAILPFTEEPATMTPEQIAALQAENEANRARIAELEGTAASFAEAQAAAARTALVATLATSLQPHVTAGRVLPALVEPLAEFMAGLSDEGEVVEFGEAVDGVTPRLSPRAFLAAFLGQLPKAVEFRELAGGAAEGSTTLTAEDLAERARAHIKQVKTDTGRDVSYVEAVNHVVATTAAEQ